MLKSKRFLIHLLVIVMAFSFTSCISIIEEVFFRKDGSGTYSMTLDMSKVANMLTMFGEDNGEMDKAMKEMNSDFNKAKVRLEKLEGVSNVRQELDKESLILTMLFDFDNVDALNRGMSDYYRDELANSVAQHQFFTFDKKTFTRTDKDIISEVLSEQMKDDEDPDFDPSILLGDMYFKSIIKFDRKLKNVSNPDYTMVDDNTISWKKFLFSKSDEGKKIAVEVKTK